MCQHLLQTYWLLIQAKREVEPSCWMLFNQQSMDSACHCTSVRQQVDPRLAWGAPDSSRKMSPYREEIYAGSFSCKDM